MEDVEVDCRGAGYYRCCRNDEADHFVLLEGLSDVYSCGIWGFVRKK